MFHQLGVLANTGCKDKRILTIGTFGKNSQKDEVVQNDDEYLALVILDEADDGVVVTTAIGLWVRLADRFHLNPLRLGSPDSATSSPASFSVR